MKKAIVSAAVGAFSVFAFGVEPTTSVGGFEVIDAAAAGGDAFAMWSASEMTSVGAFEALDAAAAAPPTRMTQQASSAGQPAAQR